MEEKRRTWRAAEEKGRGIGKREGREGERLRLEYARDRAEMEREGVGSVEPRAAAGNERRGKVERRNSKIVENVHAPSSGWPRFSQDLLSRQHFSLSSAARERERDV